jgi:23S rRNA pseudouridine1911/1915/1917 synthase
METTSELVFVNLPGERLDRFLVERYPSISRSTFQRWIAEGLVLVNGEGVKKRYQPEVGDEIEVQFVASPEMDLTPEPMDLEILFEDHQILVLNKPAGLVVHPGAGHWSGTLVHGLLHHCRSLPGDSIRPGLVHRLDRDTSGVLVVAKTQGAQLSLTRQFAERSVEKRYLALCWGLPSTARCDEPIGRDPRHRQRMAVVPEGKMASTSWQVLWSGQGVSLLDVGLHTGRTHQIRVHLAWVGCPLVGDPLYGGARSQIALEHQWLHAKSLTLTHPTSGERLQFEAPLPERLSRFSPPGAQAHLGRLRGSSSETSIK